MRLDTIGAEAIESLAPSFNNLPETDHLDGKYRLRRYSAVRCNGNCVEVGDNTFQQSSEYNKFQGDMSRKFEPIEKEVIESVAMLEICSIFTHFCGFPDNHKVDVQQMRDITLEEETPVSPEGVHQDGYDFIAIVGIDRYNIYGGNARVFKTQGGKQIFDCPLQQGEMLMIDDKELWHNAGTITKINPDKQGYMDAFILTARKSNG